MTELRYYQKNTLKLTKEALAIFDNIIVVLPTGGGKSTTFSRFVQICMKHKKRVLFLVHKRELVQQFADRLKDQFGISSGIIMSKVKPIPQRLTQVASVQTLANRKTETPDVIIIDECHHATANTYMKIVNRFPNAKIIGLTATPFRLGGKPLGNLFEKIVQPIKMRELIENRFLVETEVYWLDNGVDLSKIKTRQGDFDKTEIALAFSESSIVDGVVNNYLKYAEGKKMICFNSGVEHSKIVSDKFNAAGITSAHLDGKTPMDERTRILRRFANDEILILNNYALFTEGFDVPSTDGVILNRATKSESLYDQMVGRGLRPVWNNDYTDWEKDAEGNYMKTRCIVLDHGGNTERFGPVEDYDQIPFSLDEDRKEKKAKPRKCKICEEGLVRHSHSDDERIYWKCDCCENISSRSKNKKFTIGEEMELVLLEKDAILVEKIAKVSLKNVKKGKLPLAQLGIYREIKGYKKGWESHVAIDSGLVQVEDKEDPDSLRKAHFEISLAELQEGTKGIAQSIKEQKECKQLQS